MPRQYMPRTWLNCAHCNERFSVEAYRASKARFCSLVCKRAYRNHSIEEVLWAFVEKTDGCWLWTRGLPGNQYGQITYGGQGFATHVLAWTLKSGPVPSGMMVCHTCDVRRCVRNDDSGTYEVDGISYTRYGHLWLGTHAANLRDAALKGRMPTGEQQRLTTQRRIGSDNRAAKLTEASVQEIRRARAAGVPTQEIAATHGISRTHVYRIANREWWQHVD